MMPREAVHYITPSLLCLSLGSLSWLLKDMLRLRLEAKFRFCQVFDRIRHTILDLHAIRIIDSRGEECKFLKNNKKKNQIWLEVDQMKRKTVPIWILKQLVEMYTRDIENNPLQGIDPDAPKNDQKLVTLAKNLSELIDSNREDRECRKDLKNTYLKEEKQLDYLFRVLAKKELKGKESKLEWIALDQFRYWADGAYRNWWALQQSLRLSEKAFIQLNKLLSIFVIVLMIAIWVLRTNTFNTSELALLFTPVFASAFNSCKNMVDGLIFIFGMRPFDVGDRVDIDEMQVT
ncbi:hypothetical protein Ancab_029738 [Ancistrocladus abbreviatus]